MSHHKLYHCAVHDAIAIIRVGRAWQTLVCSASGNEPDGKPPHVQEDKDLRDSICPHICTAPGYLPPMDDVLVMQIGQQRVPIMKQAIDNTVKDYRQQRVGLLQDGVPLILI